MTFPALDAFWHEFDTGDRIKVRHARVYRWCCRKLHFVQVRDPKLQTIANETAVGLTNVSRVMDKLVAWGYVIEHSRGKYGERRFTLAYEQVAQRASTSPAA